MTIRSATSVLLVLGLALLWGCGGDGSSLGPNGQPQVDGDNGDDGDGDPAPTLTQLSAQIFTPRCAISGCHAGSFLSENMSLEADKIAANIIDVASNQMPSLKRIDPGNPDGSYLIRKVSGIDVNSQMPLGRTPLSDDEIQLIIDWVAAGAAAE